MNPKISVIVPVYNEIRYLYDCVHSIMAQTYKNIEIILVDDGSTNSAAADCDKLSLEDSRIQVIHQENKGVSEARLAGLKKSTGEWITFVDNDDLISSVMVESLVNCIDDEIDIVIGNGTEENIDQLVEQCLGGRAINSYSGVELCANLGNLSKTVPYPLWGKIYRKMLLQEIGIEKYRSICPIIFFEDILMTPIIFYHSRKCIVLDEVFYYHRVSLSSLSHQAITLGPFFYNQIYSSDILLSFLKDKRLYAYYYQRLPGELSLMIRIFCSKNEKLKNDVLEQYKNDIIVKERKYAKDYLLHSQDTLIKKICVVMFVICPSLFAIFGKVYFNNNR